MSGALGQALNLWRGQIRKGLWAVWLLANYYSYYCSMHVYMLHVCMCTCYMHTFYNTITQQHHLWIRFELLNTCPPTVHAQRCYTVVIPYPLGLLPLSFGCIYQANPSCPCYNYHIYTDVSVHISLRHSTNTSNCLIEMWNYCALYIATTNSILIMGFNFEV